jgi:hypothetical protein
VTNLEGKIYHTVGNTYGFRAWIEYGFKQRKNELGWTDYRVTDRTTLPLKLVGTGLLYLRTRQFSIPALQNTKQDQRLAASRASEEDRFPEHRLWDTRQGWKNSLNNLRLILHHFSSGACSGHGCYSSSFLLCVQGLLSLPAS